MDSSPCLRAYVLTASILRVFHDWLGNCEPFPVHVPESWLGWCLAGLCRYVSGENTVNGQSFRGNHTLTPIRLSACLIIFRPLPLAAHNLASAVGTMYTCTSSGGPVTNNVMGKMGCRLRKNIFRSQSVTSFVWLGVQAGRSSFCGGRW